MHRVEWVNFDCLIHFHTHIARSTHQKVEIILTFSAILRACCVEVWIGLTYGHITYHQLNMSRSAQSDALAQWWLSSFNGHLRSRNNPQNSSSDRANGAIETMHCAVWFVKQCIAPHQGRSQTFDRGGGGQRGAIEKFLILRKICENIRKFSIKFS